ncbi:MAG TPA: ABC transporter ATP-binding protein [Candidatus Limnocylindrales bacterium]|nr:ABC transporter ATP-binding protein [Candidatus Limnocylindrales bacterium]
MLIVDRLSKVYDAHGRRVEALADITFSVGEGEFACVVGPSGCGKTTLLRCLAGLLTPTSGTATVHGKLAVVFQEYGRSLFPWLRVRDNVGLPLKDLSKKERQAKVDTALAAVGLTDAAGAYPWQLSGGMQQRVAIARAIAYGPRVLLMDEPFAAVDAQTRADLEDLIRDVWHRLGVTLLFITHDIDESVYLGQRVIVLSSAPSRVAENIAIDLPDERDQLTTRGDARFVEFRGRVYAHIQKAKRDHARGT